MFGRKKKKAREVPVDPPKPEEKPTPAYLRDDYPYKAIGEPITNLDELEDYGTVYEIRCPSCEMTIRSQGINIKSTYERLMAGNGCIGCGNKELVVKMVDMSAMESAAKSSAASVAQSPAESSAANETESPAENA